MRKFFAMLLVILLMSCQLPAVCHAQAQDHTLVIATPYPYVANPRLEYTFLNRYPDGKIVYLEFQNYQKDAVRLLADQMPDLIEVYNWQITRYTNLDMVESLYEQTFPSGYPSALAPQARHLVEIDGAMIGVPKQITVARWKIDRRSARKLNFAIPENGWTIDDLLSYFDVFNPDTDGDGFQDISFIETTMTSDYDRNLILNKYAGSLLDQAIRTHLNDIEYFLSDDFIVQLELCKLLTTSDKVKTFWDEQGRLIDSSDTTPDLFGIVASDVGPYRTSDYSDLIAMPVAHEGETSNPANIIYYSLMRGAPHHDFATECLQMMSSEEYLAIYDGSEFGGGSQCFGMNEPSLQITMDGGIYRHGEMFYSDEYHANVRIVDASMLKVYHVNELSPLPERYQKHLTFMEQANVTFYDMTVLNDINSYDFWPALKEYFADNMTAEEVAQLLYQRVRIAVYE